jgi:hypothetical protein
METISRKHVVALLFLSLTIGTMTGCATDVTNSPRYGFGRIANHCFVLRKNCEIMRGDTTQFLLIGVGFDYTSNEPRLYTAEDYSNRISTHVYALLPAGTMVRVERLVYKQWTTSDQFTVFGHIENGPLAGASVSIAFFLNSRMVDDELHVDLNRDVFVECGQPQTKP